MKEILSMIPGVGKKLKDTDVDDKQIDYTVRRFSDHQIVLSGTCVVPADGIIQPDSFIVAENEKEFYNIQWTVEEKNYQNHYFTNILDIDYESYLNALKEFRMDEFE
jgi:hypothetical protein